MPGYYFPFFDVAISYVDVYEKITDNLDYYYFKYVRNIQWCAKSVRIQFLVICD